MYQYRLQETKTQLFNNMAFNSEALERGIEQCKNNIKTFEEAIQRERDTITQYYEQIEHNRKQELINKQKAEVLANIEVVRE